jgi:hypothetical protein
VHAEIAGADFSFRASMKAMARLQLEAGVEGIARLWQLIEQHDQSTVHLGLRAFCTSANAEAIDELPAGALLGTGAEILLAAIMAGAPVDREPSAEATP